jgi:hypothetical protein
LQLHRRRHAARRPKRVLEIKDIYLQANQRVGQWSDTVSHMSL